MDRKSLLSKLLLALTALIWGTSFVAQSVSADVVGAFTYNGARYLLAGVLLWLCRAALLRAGLYSVEGTDRRETLRGGLCCGLALFAASYLQQAGIAGTTSGKAGFITALYMVLVPLAGLLLGRRLPAVQWAAVVLAVGGMYLLCINESLRIGYHDLLVLCCAVFFAVHILVIDRFSPRADCVLMSCIQFLVAGALSCVCMLLFESPEPAAVLRCAWPILYSAVMAGAVGYTLQIVGQRHTAPAVASLIMSLESVFAVLAGWLLLHETMRLREALGCVLIFGAVLLAQAPDLLRKK